MRRSRYITANETLAKKRERAAIIKIIRDCIERLIRDLDTGDQNRVLRELHENIAATLEAMEISAR